MLRGSVARGGVLSSGVGETWEVGEDIFVFRCCVCGCDDGDGEEERWVKGEGECE